ncbi:MAG: hypothetical protein KC620_20810 [Myxococcales bacterium]|nr:hypothetical protein [Myxococcales bacterium]
MSDLNGRTVLIIEDGDEYRESLTRFVPGPTYVQTRSGDAALAVLRAQPVDLIYLDMRFDRIPRGELLGDHARATRENNGDPVRGWRYLQNNQGLFILHALTEAGFGSMPVILSYDFTREATRLRHLQKRYPSLAWVPDAITPEAIRDRMLEIIKS